jgi:excisionase family DNA binding protein
MRIDGRRPFFCALAKEAVLPALEAPQLVYTRREAAKALRVSVSHIRRMEKRGILKASRLGRAVRISRLAIEQLLANASE